MAFTNSSSSSSKHLYLNESSQKKFGYYIPSGSTKSTVSFEDSWYLYDGYYIFLNASIVSSDIASFTSKLTAAHPANQDERLILWLDWSHGMLTTVAQIAFKINQFTNFANIIAVSNFGIGNYTMQVDSSMMLYPSMQTGLLEKSDFDTATMFSFLHPESIYVNSSTVQVLFGDSSSIPGAITGMCMISDFSDNKASGWDVGFRYFANDGNKVVSQQYPIFNIKIGNYVEFKLQWDLFNPLVEANTYLEFTGQNISLKQVNKTGPLLPSIIENGTLASFFRTRLGHAIQLTPNLTAVSGPPKLVFQKMKSILGEEEYYITPSGVFTMAIEPSSVTALPTSFDIICGLSGTEYINFSIGDLMSFKPNKPAMGTSFPASALTTQSASHDCLSSDSEKYQTAWVQILPGSTTSPTYSSQPESSPLYEKCIPVTVAETKFSKPIKIFAYQKHLETPILNLGKETGVTNPITDKLTHNKKCFPMVPYAGIDKEYTILFLKETSKHTLSDFESQVIAPMRKSQLATGAPQLGPTNAVTVTPQGLLVKMDTETGAWTEVVLAKNSILQKVSNSSPPISTAFTLQFKNLNTTLTNAFQTSQQFMVISTSEALGTLVSKRGKKLTGSYPQYFNNEMSIEGWPFIFDLPSDFAGITPGDYKNIMIVKNCKGSLQDMVKAPQTWTEGAALNSVTESTPLALGNLSAWLSNYIAEGIAEYENGDEDFYQFKEIATDPNWNGTIGLNIKIAPENFPPQLEGLLAGIDKNKFAAHHFGVQVNQPQVSPTTNDLQLGEQSSLFGLINYTNPPLVNGDASSQDFDFRVRLLKVVFQNSKITNFKGKIQLLVNKLFGSKVSHTTNDGQRSTTNELLFHSRFEMHNGYPVYTFTDLNDTRFYLENNVLEYIEISKASFNTLLPTDKAAHSKNIKSRFSIWGYMGFNTQISIAAPHDVRDLFSFGEDVGNTGSKVGLSFSNFLIDMDFNLNTPRNVVYTVEHTHMDFDKALTHTRKDSLVDKLPMSMNKIIKGDNANPMSQFGFVPMELLVNGPQWEMPKDEWYGIVFDLNLGSLGDLVGKSSFTAKLLLTWGTDNRPSSYPVAVGIALPGVNSKGQLFNLEGVLKVTMDGIKLIGLENTSGSTTSYAYIIQISDIALKFLGIKLPPGATTEFLIFGDPNSHSDKIGWYGAYSNPNN